MTICGVLNIDKPAGLSSRDVVDRVLQCVRRTKVGHAGTLDPLATGVLVVCVGHATRLIEMIQQGRKRYRARFELGRQSDTDDITGKVVAGGDWRHVSNERLKSALLDFVGCIQQVPPQFSAVHVNGQRAYKLARRGQSVDLAPRVVNVFSIQVVDAQLPEIELDIECGSGTYIRSIGRDLGIKLGCGAVMNELRRTSVGDFDVAESVSLESVTGTTMGDLIQPARAAVKGMPTHDLTAQEVNAVRCGKRIPAGSIATDSQHQVALVDQFGELLGIAEYEPQHQSLQPRIVFPADN